MLERVEEVNQGVPAAPTGPPEPDHIPRIDQIGQKWPDKSQSDPEPVKPIGIIIGGSLVLIGAIMTGIGIALIPEEPPAGAFVSGAGVILAALGLEVITQSLGDLRPSWWPEHIINVRAFRRNSEK